jgi:hypothetical protein
MGGFSVSDLGRDCDSPRNYRPRRCTHLPLGGAALRSNKRGAGIDHQSPYLSSHAGYIWSVHLGDQCGNA